jgi:Chloride channel protein EriC
LDERSVSIENEKSWPLIMLFFIRNRSLFIQAFFLSSITWIIGLFYPTIIGGDQTFLVHQANYNHTWNLLYLGAAIFVISLFTIVSNSSGYPGGIFLPMMTVGGLSGKFFYDLIMVIATLFNYENIFSGINMSGYFILIGMSAFFIAVVRTPITGFILIAEMTGRYEVFFSTLVVGILVYYFTQLLRVKPMNDLLYDFMVKNSYDEPLSTTIYLEVESGSYLCDKKIDKVSLPDGCHIVTVIRDGEQLFGEKLYGMNNILMAEDQIGIELRTSDIEKVYQSLVSLSV